MPSYRQAFVALLLFVLFTLSGTASATSLFPSWGGTQSDPEFLYAEEVFIPAPAVREGDAWRIEAAIADDYYVYRHALQAEDAGGQPVELVLPDGTPRHDEFFGDTEVYLPPGMTLGVPVQTPGPLTLHWQGCAEAGICYPPQTLTVELPDAPESGAAAGAVGAAAGLTGDGAPTALAEDQAAAARLASLGPVAGALVFLGFGLLLSFTPCVLPMVPIVSGLIVGSGATPRRAVMLSAAYVLTMAATYAAVGVMAGLAGANLQAALQSPWLLGSFALLFLILAASLFGAFELRLPASLANRIEGVSRGRTGGSMAGAAALGLLSALLVGPCMTAPLAGALLYIGQTGSALTGGVALFALGLGMGLPLVLIAVFGARVLPRPGAWMERVRRVFGYVMVAMAIYMLDRFVPGPVGLMLWGAWVLAIAVGLFAWANVQPDGARSGWPLRFAAVFAGLWSTLMLVGAAAGGDSTLRPLERFGTAVAAETASLKPDYVAAKSIEDVDARIAEAGARGEWTLIDFYADWCVSCHVIERNVFGDPAVAERLAGMQVLRPDVTANDAADRKLQRHWQVPGPPSLILVGPDGEERRAQRTVGEINARDFLARLDAVGAP